MKNNIIGTLCELCPNKVTFCGSLYCTSVVCSFSAETSDCNAVFFANGEFNPCATCRRNSNCAYQSTEKPLELVF